ncbi:MAG: HD domain-containing protein [Desulfobulbaceae bacterium]|nr:HD domain-containing protein [Desulfobulbaceae bacterium]
MNIIDKISRRHSGSILSANHYSDALKSRLDECISCYLAFEETGSAALLYIAAWEGHDKNMWYEYASKHFTTLLGCEQSQIAEVFRNSVKDRRIYKYLGVEGVQREIKSNDEISSAWEELREEGKNRGSIEAVYKVAAAAGETIWLKDQANVEIYQQDNICLSLGVLTIISKEMEAEDKLKKHHDLLEVTVQERTAELTILNKQLQEEIEERKLTQKKLKESYYQLQQNLDEIINAMSLTAEQRDPYTAGHQKRTTELSIAIAEQMKLSDHMIKGLKLAGLIHDMGKISVPGEILSKPGKLNDAEIQLIKMHPQVAYDILHQIDFPWPVDQIVLQHHEKLDGTGYPNGLFGDEILIEARILCVADVVETMETHRPYRPGLGREAALKEIVKNRGILYDPAVVDACLALFKEQKFQYPSVPTDNGNLR